MRRPALLGFVGLLAACACGGGPGPSDTKSDTPSPSLPANKLIRDLTSAEANALCEWESDLLARGDCLQNAIIAGGFQAQISADPATVADARSICATELALCTAPDQIATGILDCVNQVQTGFVNCPIKVSDTEACDHDLARDYTNQPSCAALTESNFTTVLYRMNPPSCVHPECKN